MQLVFDIAGHACVAERVEMRGNTIEAEFAADAEGFLAEALDDRMVVLLSDDGGRMAVTYSVLDYFTNGGGACTATFSVNAASRRVLH
ncbi:hypothetical protein HJ526_05680 [Donghicola sp. C2-DW-16]|uniref:Uncharacterized protein n=1 Tax=Donghicola mangrovi TaxID=2729614 RepID=A0A850Q3V3_9RHOB|nr:hypothetical protein [Donghicola mangrovi]NVO23643.1 hypothetical protein [Donghicola mangrovi]NVO26900.1 hypothetical protein [Donghicola mangrovi]